MLTCREVARAVAGEELERAGLGRRMAVRLHLLLCPNCHRYAAQIRAIGETARQIFCEENLDTTILERLRDILLKSAIPGGGISPDSEGRTAPRR